MKKIRTLRNIINFLVRHPLSKKNKTGAVLRFIKLQLYFKFFDFNAIYENDLSVKFILRKGLSAATGMYYSGLFEFEEMSFFLHFLREGDLMIDIGANIGSYSVMAAKHCGANCISVEPIPLSFAFLRDNVRINDLEDKVILMNKGLGSKMGKLRFSNKGDASDGVIWQGDMTKAGIEIDVDTLNNICSGLNPIYLKIDVEGFETEVIKGGDNVFSNSSIKVVQIELKQKLADRYNFDINHIHEFLKDHGFSLYHYSPFNRKIEKNVNVVKPTDCLYIRDLDFVMLRILNAKKIEIMGHEY